MLSTGALKKGCTSVDIGRCVCLKRFFTVFIENCVEQAKAQAQRKD